MNNQRNEVRLAIFSPLLNAYSETFIQAHKALPFHNLFYHGGFLPNRLEGGKDLFNFSFVEKIQIRLNKNFNLTKHALYFSLKKEKIDCILAEYAPTACQSLQVIQKLNIPLIVHFHGYDATDPGILEHYKTQYQELFIYARKVFVVSYKMKQELLNLGCKEDKLEVTACGPHPSFFENNPTFDSDQFIVVSRFDYIKGIIYTIVAFKKLIEEFPNVNLVLVGDGPTLESCKQLVNALDLAKYVEFKGVLNTKEIKHLMNESVAFLQHSVTLEGGITEGLPVAIMEAQAAGLPVVASKNGGIPEIIVNNETGFLVEEKDVDSMAAHMVSILKDKELAAELGKKGRQRISQKFNQEIHLKQIENAVLQITDL